jgi:hypothetical protein
MRLINLFLFAAILVVGNNPANAARTEGTSQEMRVMRLDGSVIPQEEAARLLDDANELASRSSDRGVQLACNGFLGNGGPARPCPVGPGGGGVIIVPVPVVPVVPYAPGWAPGGWRPGFNGAPNGANTCRNGIYFRTYAVSDLILGESCRIPMPGGRFIWGIATYE